MKHTGTRSLVQGVVKSSNPLLISRRLPVTAVQQDQATAVPRSYELMMPAPDTTFPARTTHAWAKVPQEPFDDPASIADCRQLSQACGNEDRVTNPLLLTRNLAPCG